MKRMTFKGSAIVSLGLAFAPLAASAASLKSLDAVMLNPRPLPPKGLVAHISHGDEVMLNPQPLPPEGPGRPHLAWRRGHAESAAAAPESVQV